uniref:Uncharacterized protein n=1 Tax=Anguilla anguilla TaxID=7936 RepID=A0A0E9T8T5_ANGAN
MHFLALDNKPTTPAPIPARRLTETFLNI